MTIKNYNFIKPNVSIGNLLNVVSSSINTPTSNFSSLLKSSLSVGSPLSLVSSSINAPTSNFSSLLKSSLSVGSPLSLVSSSINAPTSNFGSLLKSSLSVGSPLSLVSSSINAPTSNFSSLLKSSLSVGSPLSLVSSSINAPTSNFSSLLKSSLSVGSPLSLVSSSINAPTSNFSSLLKSSLSVGSPLSLVSSSINAPTVDLTIYREVLNDLKNYLKEVNIDAIDINSKSKKSIFTKDKLFIEDLLAKVTCKFKSVFSLEKFKEDIESNIRCFIVTVILNLIISPAQINTQNPKSTIDFSDVKYIYIQNEGEVIKVLKTNEIIKQIDSLTNEIKKID